MPRAMPVHETPATPPPSEALRDACDTAALLDELLAGDDWRHMAQVMLRDQIAAAHKSGMLCHARAIRCTHETLDRPSVEHTARVVSLEMSRNNLGAYRMLQSIERGLRTLAALERDAAAADARNLMPGRTRQAARKDHPQTVGPAMPDRHAPAAAGAGIRHATPCTVSGEAESSVAATGADDVPAAVPPCPNPMRSTGMPPLRAAAPKAAAAAMPTDAPQPPATKSDCAGHQAAAPPSGSPANDLAVTGTAGFRHATPCTVSGAAVSGPQPALPLTAVPPQRLGPAFAPGDGHRARPQPPASNRSDTIPLAAPTRRDRAYDAAPHAIAA